jgi:DNA-binding CsgD family transcriptional regulator
MKLLPVLAFASFILWLLAVPMDGPLPGAIGMPAATRYFLLPHAGMLALLGLACPPRWFARLAPPGIVATVLLTMLLPWQINNAPWILFGLGLSGAFVTIRAGLALRRQQKPVMHAALGLVLGNLLLFPFCMRPTGQAWLFSLTSLPLLLLLKCPPSIPASAGSGKLWPYLPFILVFNVVSGLMYSFIFPAYKAAAFALGMELSFYMVAVLATALIIRRERDLALICGIILGMAAFALLQYPSRSTINLSMFIMQAGAGAIDLFLLVFLLSLPAPIRSFGVGLATLCLGIAGGKWVGRHFADMAEAIALCGHLMLNLSLLTLYFLGRRRHGHTLPMALPREGNPAAMADDNADGLRIPDHLRRLLSEREYLVLVGTVDGKSYRDIAESHGISESSVKTYMRRINSKLGAGSKKELLQRLEGVGEQPIASPEFIDTDK